MLESKTFGVASAESILEGNQENLESQIDALLEEADALIAKEANL